jgi:hypothetical protein
MTVALSFPAKTSVPNAGTLQQFGAAHPPDWFVFHSGLFPHVFLDLPFVSLVDRPSIEAFRVTV